MVSKHIERAKCKAHAVACKAKEKAQPMEHLGFVAYAGLEVAHISRAIYFVSCWLLATGLLVVIANKEL